MSAARDGWAALRRAAKAQGWRIEVTGGSHLRWVSPAGAAVITAESPSDPRSLLNTRAQLRRAGFVDEAREQRLPAAKRAKGMT